MRRFKHIVVLTGSGISAESGIATFRDKDGIWAKYDVEEVATPEAFARDPALVQRFYNMRRRALLAASVRPNPAHLALARLETALPGRVLLVTQNIDDLHERAGSRSPVHIHGELLKARCSGCAAVTSWREDIMSGSRCPACQVAGRLRPHVVWFGEMPLELDAVYAALAECELFAAIGTSGLVYPAAGFVRAVRHGRTLELNLEPSAVRSDFDELRSGSATRTVPALVDELIRGLSRP